MSQECIGGPLRVLWKATPPSPNKARQGMFEHPVATTDGLFVSGLCGKSSTAHRVSLGGEQLWHFDSRNDLHFAYWPTVAHGVMLLNDDCSFLLDLVSGKIKYNHGLDSWGQSVADDERFYWVNAWHVHGPALYVGGFSARGDNLWKKNKYGGVVPMDMMDDLGAIALDDGVVFQAANYKFATFSGLFALDARTGEPRWSNNVAPVGHPSLAGGRLFVIERKKQERWLVAHDQKTGEQLWSVLVKGALAAAPVLAGGMVLVDTERDGVFSFDAATGEPRWRARLGVKHHFQTGLETTLLVAGGSRTVVAVAGGDVVLLSLDRGETLWRGRVAEQPLHSPILAGGRLYAVAGGDLVAMEGPPPLAPGASNDLRKCRRTVSKFLPGAVSIYS